MEREGREEKKKKMGDRNREMRAMSGWEAETGIGQLQAKEHRGYQLPAEARRKAGRGFSGRASRGTQPSDILILDFWPLELWENKFLLF